MEGDIQPHYTGNDLNSTCGNISNRVDSTRIETTLSIKGRNNSHEKDNRAVSMTNHMLSNISMDVDMS